MSKESVAAVVRGIIDDHLGHVVEQPGTNSLQDCLGCTSLDVISIQVGLEEAFGLKFATGAEARGAIDRDWDRVTSVTELVALVERHIHG